ncbi:E3 ubiquitin-protein ligase ARIH2-like, partial [Rhincodon typus]
MSVDMNSQSSDSNDDYNGDSEEEDQGDMSAYYEGVECDVEQQGADAFDPEEYQFTCLSYKESENVLNEQVDTMADALK